MKWLLLLILTIFFPETVLAAQFTEIAYDLVGADSGREWVEIYNDSAQPLNLAGGYFFDGAYHKILFSSGQEGSLLIPPSQYVVLADNPGIFLAENPQFSGLVFDTVMNLPNFDKNRINPFQLGLADEKKKIFLDLNYWPTEIGKDGMPLALAENGGWFDSSTVGGSPGLPNPPIVKKSYSREVTLAEIVANPLGPDADGEWVELYNSSAQPVSLEGWAIADRPTASGNQQRHKIAADVTIAANSYATITLTGSFLNNKDELVFLLWPNGEIADERLVVGSAKEGESYAKFGEGWSYTDNITVALPNVRKSTIFIASSPAKRVASSPNYIASLPAVKKTNAPTLKVERVISPLPFASPLFKASSAPTAVPTIFLRSQIARTTASPLSEGKTKGRNFSGNVSPSPNLIPADPSPIFKQIVGERATYMPNALHIVLFIIFLLCYGLYCLRVKIKSRLDRYSAWRNRDFLS